MLVYRSVTAFWVDSLTFHHHLRASPRWVGRSEFAPVSFRDPKKTRRRESHESSDQFASQVSGIEMKFAMVEMT